MRQWQSFITKFITPKAINLQVTQNDHTLLENMRYGVLLPRGPWIMGVSYRSFLLRPLLKLAMYKALLSYLGILQIG